jgi:ubiquinone/menaquinone biosynthesis C-methylase UbiE
MNMKPQYSDTMLESMQATYGAGFLSPGAAEETRQMLSNFDLKDKSCLDLGCGVGGACVLMSKEYQPGRVVGVDTELKQLHQAKLMSKHENLKNIEFKQITADTRLPFAECSFDLVITKDVICHVEYKTKLFKDVLRILRPGGMFVIGDWHLGENSQNNSIFSDWLKQLNSAGLIFYFESASSYQSALETVGFTTIATQNHTEWSISSAQTQYDLATNQNRASTIETLGDEAYNRRVLMTKTRLEGLKNGSIDHWHISGFKH